MKVRFAGIPDTNAAQIYNYDDLSVGSVYDVLEIPRGNRNLLLIQNDKNYERYYHKDGFIMACPSDDDACRYLEGLDTLVCAELSKAVVAIKKIKIDPELMHDLIESFSQYPEATIQIFKMLNDEETYAEQLTVPSKDPRDFLIKHEGTPYKYEPRDRVVRILSRDDYKLAGKHIYTKSTFCFGHKNSEPEA